VVTRFLTSGERELAQSVYGDSLDLGKIEIRRRKWFAFQPRDTVMAPCGHLHFHPSGSGYRDDYSVAPIGAQGLFVHELCHVWQTQRQGRLFLPLMRHPFCRYDYAIEPGRPLGWYGIEQQAEIVRHAHMMRQGYRIPDKPPLAVYERLLADALGSDQS
jgi:hypothetical protein